MSILNRKSRFNLDQIKTHQAKTQAQYRKKVLGKIDKWNNFRQRREDIIDAYISQKRKQRAVEELNRIFTMKTIIL